MAAARNPLTPGQDDYPTQDAALAGALHWVGILTPAEHLEIRFGQRDPITVGPGRYYWHAIVSTAVHCGVPEDRSDATPERRLEKVTRAWRIAYYPDQEA